MVKMIFSISQSPHEKWNSPLNDLNNPVLVVIHNDPMTIGVETFRCKWVRKGLTGLLFILTNKKRDESEFT